MSITTEGKYFISILITSLILGVGCVEKEEIKPDIYPTIITDEEDEAEDLESTTVLTVNASERIDLNNKGVGPIKTMSLDEINPALVSKGMEVFKVMCTACHKPEKKFIGPAPKGILKRRSPEWVMNMILNPENMIKNDSLAKELLIEFNGAPMANQNLTEEEARAVLEYFRSL